MEAEQPAVALKCYLDGGQETCDKRPVVGIELSERPVTHALLVRGDRLGAAIRAREQPGVGVPHDDWAVQRPQTRHRLSGLRPALHRVAEAGDLIDRVSPQIM